LAGNNDAQYLKHGKQVNIPTKNLFKDRFSLKINGFDDLEVYPNRDSLPYIDIYGIPETQTMYRGTFRYGGWCETMDALKELKLTSQEVIDFTGMTYADMMALMIGAKKNDAILKSTAKYLKKEESNLVIQAMNFLGLFSDKPMNRKKDSTYEIVSDLMIEKMMIKENERDMSIMEHIFLAEYPDGKREVIKSKLLDFGIPGKETSIARCVALPAACAVRMILEEEIILTGVHIPVLPEIYNPIMIELENLGIEMVEEFGLPISHNIS
jgi:saccharopine dehydrogenase (NADP+, L-glutamate forming)